MHHELNIPTSYDNNTVAHVSRARGESEAIAIMEDVDSTRGGDSEWLPIGDFASDPLDSMTHHHSTAALLLRRSPSAAAATNNTNNTITHRTAIGSKRAHGKAHLHTSDSDSSSRRASRLLVAVVPPLSPAAISQHDPHATLCSRKHVGLLLSVALASLLSTWLKRGVLPLMQRRLHMAQYQKDAAEVLLLVPWSCSFVLGFCSDIVPIGGSHRKAYMIIGWLLAAAALGAIATMHHSHDVGDRDSDSTATSTDDDATIINGYVFLLGAACFGAVLSIMMAEIYVIALSKRESLVQRGHLVGTFLLVQFGFQAIAQFGADTLLFQSVNNTNNDVIQSRLDFQHVVVFLAIFALVPIPIVYYLFNDELLPSPSDGVECASCDRLVATTTTTTTSTTAESDNDIVVLLDASSTANARSIQSPNRLYAIWTTFRTHWLLLWHTLEEYATWQIVCFLCLFIFFSEFTLKYPFVVLDQWVGVTPKTTSTSKIATELMFVAAVAIWKAACVNTQWGLFVVLSYLGVFICLPMAYLLIVAFSGGSRVGPIALYMFFASACQGFIRALAVVLEVVMMIEIAPTGGEGAVLGTIVSIAAIMRLVSQTFSNLIGYVFGTQLLLAPPAEATAATPRDEPMLVATALILCYTLRLLALIGVLFLPSQKLALRRLLRVGGRKRFRAWATLAILVVALLLGTVLNTLVITPDTMCLHVLGGSGCES